MSGNDHHTSELRAQARGRRQFHILGSGTPSAGRREASRSVVDSVSEVGSRTSSRCVRTSTKFGTVRIVELGYARVSTAKQDLDRQIEALAEAGVARDRIYVDKKSGATVERPGLRAVTPTPARAT